MNKQYMETFAEVDVILRLMPKELLDKIPLSFRNLISNKKSVDYIVNIKKDIPIEKQELKKETKAILSLIYRSYLVSPEEKEKLKLEDMQALKKFEEEKREKYNPDNIFQKNSENVVLENEISQLPIDYSQLKWYQKLYNKIIKIFKFTK